MIPEITFDIYGEGGERNALQDLIRELGAEDYIHLHGHVNLAKSIRNMICLYQDQQVKVSV